MAVETLVVQNVLRTGAQENAQSVTTADGFRFLNDGQTVLSFTEKNAANCEVTATAQKVLDGLAAASRVVDVTASEGWILGPWPPDQFNDADGYINFTIEADQATAVTPLSCR